MTNLNKKNFDFSDINSKRDQRILSQVNLKKLPFKISVDNFSTRYLEMFLDLKPLFKYQEGEYAMKWCLSTEKKMKVFLVHLLQILIKKLSFFFLLISTISSHILLLDI